MTTLHGWHTRQLDFVLAFPQAPVEKVLYMLQLHKNVYGQKQADGVWNQHLVKKLTKELKFEQSKVDKCVVATQQLRTF
jgi:hypothetical protein